MVMVMVGEMVFAELCLLVRKIKSGKEACLPIFLVQEIETAAIS